jgi:small subunit ribosomal protein S1
VGHPKEVVHEGDVVTLRVIKVDPERRRIGLSLRKVDSPAYADLDWKMALADEVGKAQEQETEESGPMASEPADVEAISPEEEDVEDVDSAGVEAVTTEQEDVEDVASAGVEAVSPEQEDVEDVASEESGSEDEEQDEPA